MTPEEIKAMRGTEFTYVFDDGDTIRAFVKEYDPEVGLTLSSLEAETVNGWIPDPDVVDIEEDGTFCVGSYIDYDYINEVMELIRDTGKLPEGVGSSGIPTCNFR